jgi:predicted RNA-binding protein Jag
MSNATYSGRNIDVAVQNAATARGVDSSDIQYDVMAGQGGGFALIKVRSGGPSAPVLGQESLSGSGPSPDGDNDSYESRPERAESGGRGDDRETRSDDSGPRRDDRETRSDDRETRSDDSGPRRDDRETRSDDRGPRRDDRETRSDDSGPRRDDRETRSDDRGPRSDDRGPRSDDRGPRRDDRGGDDGGPRRGAWPDVPSDGPTEVNIQIAEGAELSDVAQAALAILVDLLTEMDYGLDGTVSEIDERVQFELQSEAYGEVFAARDMGLLRSLEYLVEKMTSDGDRRVKISLDVNGVRAQADEDLGESARDLATRAIEEERVYKMGPLDPRGRRLVHIALREMKGVTTESEGEGVFRRICIIPE